MNGRIIEIIVARNGSTQVQTRGFAGSSCLEASKFIEDALGKKSSERTTSEFFDVINQQQRLQEGGG